MATRADALTLIVKVLVYIAFYFAAAFLIGPLAAWTGGYLVGVTATSLLAATITNVLCLRIYAQRGIAAIGMGSDRSSLINLAIGWAGGMGAAALVLGGSLLFRAARLEPDPANPPAAGSFVFITVLLLFGSAGEELLFRGFGFQVLLRRFGGWTTIVPVGVIFALLHAGNPGATWLGLVNTAGFGILFGYAFMRTHDIWLPIGLHFGWNFALPLFGVNVSGLNVRLTGLSMHWYTGALWSGGDYGPEASVLTSGVLLILFFFIGKAPVRRQVSALLDEPAAGPVTG